MFHMTLVESLKNTIGITSQFIINLNIFFVPQKLGVPLEARIKVQLNIMVEQSNIYIVRQFPSMVFPVMWLEEVRNKSHYARLYRFSFSNSFEILKSPFFLTLTGCRRITKAFASTHLPIDHIRRRNSSLYNVRYDSIRFGNVTYGIYTSV